MTSLFPFFVLFLFLNPIEGRDPPFHQKRRERISVCYGVLYGSVAFEPVKFFVNYYQKLGVEKVVAFLHPTLNQLLPSYQEIDGLSVTMWESEYPTNVLFSHRLNHKIALDKCIQNEIRSGATSIIVCDLDEFLYFDPKIYSSLQDFLWKFRQKNVSQVSLYQMYYEIDLCLQESSTVTIWNSPYRTRGLFPAYKSIFFTDKYLGLKATRPVHSFNVSGETVVMERVVEAHFKHFRRFPVWDGECEVVKGERTVQHRMKKDKNDPGHKATYSGFHTYERDYLMGDWKNFVENSHS